MLIELDKISLVDWRLVCREATISQLREADGKIDSTLKRYAHKMDDAMLQKWLRMQTIVQRVIQRKCGLFNPKRKAEHYWRMREYTERGPTEQPVKLEFGKR